MNNPLILKKNRLLKLKSSNPRSIKSKLTNVAICSSCHGCTNLNKPGANLFKLTR